MEITNDRWGIERIWESVLNTPQLTLSEDVVQAVVRCREYLKAS